MKPRPIGGHLSLPGLFGPAAAAAAAHQSLFGSGSATGLPAGFGGFAHLDPGASTGSGSSSSSVEELRRKAQEHSAALLASLQHHAMEFHLQQQRKSAKEAADAAQAAADSANSSSD